METDQKILCAAIEGLGHSTEAFNWFDDLNEDSRADINIFFEHLNSKNFPLADLNWFIPNPEWCFESLELIDQCDLIVCRTHEVERIFKELRPTYFLGFTSPDCYDPSIKKNYFRFLHVAGGSKQKGTPAIMKTWQKNAHFPLLTIIKFSDLNIKARKNVYLIPTYIPLAELRTLQNQCGVHLCLSETEGFGHYLMEAMSTGAVVLTTDAPPMNEFIQEPLCLVPYKDSQPQHFGINYYVDPIGLERKIKRLSKLSKKELKAIGVKNRAAYLSKRDEFYRNLEKLFIQFK